MFFTIVSYLFIKAFQPQAEKIAAPIINHQEIVKVKIMHIKAISDK